MSEFGKLREKMAQLTQVLPDLTLELNTSLWEFKSVLPTGVLGEQIMSGSPQILCLFSPTLTHMLTE